MRIIRTRSESNPGQLVRLQLGPGSKLFLRPPTLIASNFTDLWLRDYIRCMQRPKPILSIQKLSKIIKPPSLILPFSWGKEWWVHYYNHCNLWEPFRRGICQMSPRNLIIAVINCYPMTTKHDTTVQTIHKIQLLTYILELPQITCPQSLNLLVLLIVGKLNISLFGTVGSGDSHMKKM